MIDVFPDVLRGISDRRRGDGHERKSTRRRPGARPAKQAAEAAKQQADAEVDADARAEFGRQARKDRRGRRRSRIRRRIRGSGKQGRLTVGADEHKRLKAIAAETTRAMRELDAELAAEESQVAAMSEQGSQEWLQERAGRWTASRFADLDRHRRSAPESR